MAERLTPKLLLIGGGGKPIFRRWRRFVNRAGGGSGDSIGSGATELRE